MSAMEKTEPTCELPPVLVIRSACNRMRCASVTESSPLFLLISAPLELRSDFCRTLRMVERPSAAECHAPLFDGSVRDVRIPFEPTKMKVLKYAEVQGGPRLTWPHGIVQLVECYDRALRHSRKQGFQRAFRWFVQINVEEKKAHDYVRILFYEPWQRLHHVAFDKLNLWNVPQETVTIVLKDQLLQLIIRVRLQTSDIDIGDRRTIIWPYARKAGERVETVDTSGEVFRLEHGAEFGPRHHAKSPKNPALDHRPLHWKNQLIQLVHRQEAL